MLEFFLKELEGTQAKLLPVSKTHGESKILEAYQAGMKRFGENKVQEMTRKAGNLPNDIEWHLIGHLQTNKVKTIAPYVGLVHSVDSLKLLLELEKQGEKARRKIPCLLQIHIASEETKFGISEQELWEILLSDTFKHLKWVEVQGLMGMATLTDNRQQIRQEFKVLRALFDQIAKHKISGPVEMKELSMGMSNDYKIAIDEGSTIIRIGTAIFGYR